jgi:hypothetical protein
LSLNFLLGLDPYQKMKMIGQQTIGKRLGHQLDMAGIKLQKVAIVAFFLENVLSIITPIVDMVVAAIFEGGWAGHGHPPTKSRP